MTHTAIHYHTLLVVPVYWFTPSRKMQFLFVAFYSKIIVLSYPTWIQYDRTINLSIELDQMYVISSS